MKRYLLFALAAGVSLVAFGGMSPGANGVWLTDATNRPVVFVGPVKFNFAGNKMATVTGVSTNADGSLALAFSVADRPEVSLAATFREEAGKFTLDYALSGATNFTPGGAQGTLHLAKGMGKMGYPEKHGTWMRCAANPLEGEPFETYNVKLKRLGDERSAIWYVVDGDENWSGGRSENLRFSSVSNGMATARFTLYAARPDEEGFEVAARHAEKPFAIKLTTPRRNNIFDSGIPEVTLRVSNTGETNAIVKVRFFARDWDGETPFDRTVEMALKPGERGELTAQLPAERGIWFVEGGVVDAAATADGPPESRNEGAIPGGPGAVPAASDDLADVFTRTTVAFLPPHEFRHRDTSVFGVIPSWQGFKGQEEAELSLMERMGVRWIRSGTDLPRLRRHGFETIAQIDFTLKHAFDPENSNDVARVASCVARLKRDNVIYAEMGNEIGHRGTAETRHALFAAFETWLDAYRAERARQGADFKIIYGTSAVRPDLMRIMDEHNVWEKLDEYVIHPGRGYWTADTDSGGWRYLGLIRGTRRILVKDLGVRNPKFHLTEIYVKTKPNDGWADSYRQSAENMVLNAALALEEDVRTFTVHKLHEGIGWNVNGIHPGNGKIDPMEYHYGLLNRDNSPKPSFMGYVTAAEELDGATFRNWIFHNEKKDKLRGLIFNSPEGPFALLWDRAEGFLLTGHAPKPRVKGAPFFHYEPWMRHWRVRNVREFKTLDDEVTVIDPIGRRKTLKAVDGRVSLALDGEPVFVRGLDLSEFNDPSRHEAVHKAKDVEDIDRANRE